MELPHLGKYCTEENCRRLDFLPVKCDGCSKVFCGEHYKYSQHKCPNEKKNVQVPVCPLCNAVVLGNINELPDIRVSRHIDNDCKSDTAVNRRQKVYTNRCTFKGCKQKEMIPILCDTCNLNFCLKHRHPIDHACTRERSVGKPGQAAGQAALKRYQQSSSMPQSFVSRLNGATSSMTNGFNRMMEGMRPSPNPTALQGNMSEEEAMRLAMQASLGANGITPITSNTMSSQEHEDFMLAKALAESEAEAARSSSRNNGQRRNNQNCEIS